MPSRAADGRLVCSRVKQSDARGRSTGALLRTCLFLLVGSCSVGPPVPVPGLFRYSREEADAFVKQTNLEPKKAMPEWVMEMGRDSLGSRLYLYGFSDSAAIVDTGGKLTLVPEKVPRKVGGEIARGAWLNDAGQWAAWVTPGEAHFLGWTRPAKMLWVDPGVRHYVVETDEGVLELGTTDGRLKQSVAGLDPLDRFAHADTIYLFGLRGRNEIHCQVLRETSSGYELQRTVKVAPFGSPAGIVDMDVKGERVVVERARDLNPYWVLFDFRTGTLTNIGDTSRFGLFLREDLLHPKRVGRAESIRLPSAPSPAEP